MVDEADGTVYYNSNEANLLYRICTKHDVPADKAELIAQEYGAAEARSFEGRLKKAIQTYTLKAVGGAAIIGGSVLAGYFGLK